MPATEATAHQFDDLAQQHEADTIGMWIFLATEILLFGALFLAYAVYRSIYPDAWLEGSHHQYVIAGTINTAVLLLSSLTVALATQESREDRWRRTALLLLATALLGAVFLGTKGYEYFLHYREGTMPGVRFEYGPNVGLYFVFYYVMTGLHAVHMAIGVGLMLVLVVFAQTGRLRNAMAVEISGLYWHLVDIIWVFLFPLFYLIG